MIESFIVTGNDWHKNSWTVDSENQNNNIFVIRTPKPPVANSDGLINCLLQPGLLFCRPLKSIRVIFFNLSDFVAPGQILLPRQSQ